MKDTSWLYRARGCPGHSDHQPRQGHLANCGWGRSEKRGALVDAAILALRTRRAERMSRPQRLPYRNEVGGCFVGEPRVQMHLGDRGGKGEEPPDAENATQADGIPKGRDGTIWREDRTTVIRHERPLQPSGPLGLRQSVEPICFWVISLFVSTNNA